MDKAKDHLAGWKANTLLMVGRTTLIHSITSTIPSHIMQQKTSSHENHQSLRQDQSRFSLGIPLERRKIHLLNSDTITKPRREGGLGQMKRMGQNLALAEKFVKGKRHRIQNISATSIR